MEKGQIDEEAMVALVFKALDEAAAGTYAGMPGIDARITLLGEKLGLVRSNAAQQSANITGSAIEKHNRRVTMERNAIFVAKKAASFAYDSNNAILFDKVNISEVKLSRLTNFDSQSVCKDIYMVVLPYVADLAAYNVTAEDLEKVNVSVKAFLAFKDEPKDSITDRKAATEGIAINLAACREILVGIDLAIRGIEYSNPEFYKKYFMRREIKHTGHRVLSLRGHITTTDGLPLKGVRIVIEGTDVVKNSTDMGNFQVAHMKEAVYVIRCSKNGFVDVRTTVAINDNERSEVRIVMEVAEVLF